MEKVIKYLIKNNITPNGLLAHNDYCQLSFNQVQKHVNQVDRKQRLFN